MVMFFLTFGVIGFGNFGVIAVGIMLLPKARILDFGNNIIPKTITPRKKSEKKTPKKQKQNKTKQKKKKKKKKKHRCCNTRLVKANMLYSC